MKALEFLKQNILYENLKANFDGILKAMPSNSDFETDLIQYVFKNISFCNFFEDFCQLGKDFLEYDLEQTGKRIKETYRLEKGYHKNLYTFTFLSDSHALQSLEIQFANPKPCHVRFFQKESGMQYHFPVNWHSVYIQFLDEKIIKLTYTKTCAPLNAKEICKNYYVDGKKLASRTIQSMNESNSSWITEESFVLNGVRHSRFYIPFDDQHAKTMQQGMYQYYDFLSDVHHQEIARPSVLSYNQFKKCMKGTYSRIRSLKKESEKTKDK